VTEREEEGVTDFPLYFLLFLLICFAFEFYHVRHVSFQISIFFFFSSVICSVWPLREGFLFHIFMDRTTRAG
jgi:hypothetical protein